MGLRGYLLFACGQLGLMTLARFFFQWVLFFAGSEHEHGDAPLFAAATVGLVFFGFRIFDAVSDPVAGTLADAWVRRGRQRRTLLWLSFALPPAGLALVFSPTPDMSLALRWGLLGTGMFVFFLGYTLYAIPYWSLIEDYSAGDRARRARLSNILGAALLIATGIGFVVSPTVIERTSFHTAAIVFAAVSGLLMLLPYFAVNPSKVNAASPPDGAKPLRSRENERPIATGLRVALSHRRFRAVIVLFAGSQMSFTVMTAAASYIAVRLLGGTTGDVALLLGPFLLLAIPSFVFVPRLVRRHGWERLTLLATLALGVVYAGTGFLGSGRDPLMVAAIVFACGGPMAAVLLGLEGEAITSCAAEQPLSLTSVYFGIYNFVVKALNGLALFLTGVLASAAEAGSSVAVRAMGWLAGSLLVAGVIGYLLLRPRTNAETAR